MTDKAAGAWTTEEIRSKMETDQSWLERGIVAIWKRQTRSEQDMYATVSYNNVGFTAADASYLTYAANWINSGKHLSGKHVEKSRKRMVKYAGQLAKIANGMIA